MASCAWTVRGTSDRTLVTLIDGLKKRQRNPWRMPAAPLDLAGSEEGARGLACVRANGKHTWHWWYAKDKRGIRSLPGQVPDNRPLARNVADRTE